jgi:hypothetical protein
VVRRAVQRNAPSLRRQVRRKTSCAIAAVASLGAASCAQASKAAVHVPSNAASQTLPSTAREAVRDTYDAAGDGPAQLYVASDRPCMLR